MRNALLVQVAVNSVYASFFYMSEQGCHQVLQDVIGWLLLGLVIAVSLLMGKKGDLSLFVLAMNLALIGLLIQYDGQISGCIVKDTRILITCCFASAFGLAVLSLYLYSRNKEPV